MAPPIPFCDTPGQSAIVGVLAGLAGGLAGVSLGLETAGVVAVAAVLALTGDVGAHLLRGDDQFQAAVRQVTRGG
jgi:LytS/YehU family sensor histidine kinase